MHRSLAFVVLLLPIVLACGSSSPGPGSIESAAIELDPNGTTPLAALLQVSTSEPSTLSIAVTGPDEAWTISVEEVGSQHEVAILGLTADATFQVVVTAVGEDGPNGVLGLSITTAPLPEPFPELVVETSIPESMEPGLTMFDIGGTENYLVIIDPQGRVVWLYVPPGPGVGDVRLLPNGNLLYLAGPEMYEMTMLGDIVRHIEPEERDHNFHHEVFPTVEGTYLTLGFDIREVDDFHTSETDAEPLATVDVTDDTILEVEADGTVVRRHNLLDILDPSRIGYDSLSEHFRLETPNDWAHANGIIADGDSVIVSVRHQDTVFKARLDTGELEWILAPHDNWSSAFQPYLLEPSGEGFAWSFHQHAPQVTTDGTLLMFDNGNHRASPYDGQEPTPAAQSYSRAVEYRIDEANMTVEQVWQYGAGLDPRLFASFVSDADHLPATGNVLINFAGLRGVGSESSEDMGRGTAQSRLREIERGSRDRIVFDVSIYSDIEESPDGFRSYRSERIPSLHD
jgi:arylsulfate sulfotransferase